MSSVNIPLPFQRHHNHRVHRSPSLIDKSTERMGISPFLSHRRISFRVPYVCLLCSRSQTTLLTISPAAISLTVRFLHVFSLISDGLCHT